MGEAVMKEGMATADAWTPSRRMRSAAVAERERVERELQRLDARRDELGQELAAVSAAADELRDHLRVLNRFVHEELNGSNGDARPALRVVKEAHAYGGGEVQGELLKGARIRETAVRVLAGTPQAEAPIHYRTWFELLRSQGFMPMGKDALATFLTQLGRSPVIRRGGGPGMYALEFSYPQRARQRLTQLRAELQRTHELSPDAGVDAIAEARERRARLTSEIEATERALEEALRSLGDDVSKDTARVEQ
jgi:hypothetical protein